MKIKRVKRDLEKFFNSWIGALAYIAIGILLIYFLMKSTNMLHYLFVVIGVPLLYLFKQYDSVPYIYFAVFLAFSFHFLIGIALATNYPVVAVVSSSMEHDASLEADHYQWLERNMGYNRSYINSWPLADGFVVGDMPIVQHAEKYDVGNVIVYSIPNQNTPVIHRIISINSDGTYMTKGDNNPQLLPFESSVKPEQIHGMVIFIIPKLGYFKVMATKYLGI